MTDRLDLSFRQVELLPLVAYGLRTGQARCEQLAPALFSRGGCQKGVREE